MELTMTGEKQASINTGRFHFKFMITNYKLVLTTVWQL